MTVVGAGPYGLSIAAHLIGSGVDTRVLGDVMSFWQGHMPAGMKLRSGWGATSFSAPGGKYSLDEFVTCGEMPRTEPIPLKDFNRYGQWFQQKAVRQLEPRKVRSVDYNGERFRVALQDGEAFDSREVVIATGLSNQAMRPAPFQFQGIPPELVSHTADHVDLGRFQGQRIAVIGRGQSAIESAALLAEAGAEVEVICRGPVHWIGAETLSGAKAEPGPINALVKCMRARGGVGPFPLDWLADMPGAMHLLPMRLRWTLSARCLRPAAAGWLMPRMSGVRVRSGRVVTHAKPQIGRIALQLDDGTCSTVDHALLATGYKIDIRKPGILSPNLVEGIELHPGTGCPALSGHFESSVRGLYFAGASAVPSYGPLMRFVAGTRYAARSIAQGARVRA
jgi:cation diffusion facilitator CzcD-associated flavoprotein CzcO